MAIGTWMFLSHEFERCSKLEVGWIAQIYGINLLSTLLLAGGLHLYFYTFKGQGIRRQIDGSELGRDNVKFFCRAQVWDNMLYTCVSGVTIWTAYVILFVWLYANNYIPWLAWGDSIVGTIWFILLFPLLNMFANTHFYFVHRLLHTKLFWRWHAVHHRNINVGPWSGFSMHPVEHILYLSSVIIHMVVISHPIHMLYHMYFNTLGAVTTHTGYSSLLIKGRAIVDLGDFHHQLHHRYFDCNYGNRGVPWDKWFGSFHDGTPEATARVRAHQQKKRQRG